MAKKDKPETVSRKRARLAGEAFTKKRGKKKRGEEPEVVSTPSGEVELLDVAYDEDEKVGWVDVLVGQPGNDDPHFRVVNPPIYVEDPNGDIYLSGMRFREDPLAALAQTIAMNGGARKERRR